MTIRSINQSKTSKKEKFSVSAGHTHQNTNYFSVLHVNSLNLYASPG